MARIDLRVECDVERLIGDAVDALGLASGEPFKSWERSLAISLFYAMTIEREGDIWTFPPAAPGALLVARIDPAFLTGFIARTLRLLGRRRLELA